MDEADTRRGVDTVNARWGNLQAILAGDFLLARAVGDRRVARHRGRRAAGAHDRPAVRGPDRASSATPTTRPRRRTATSRRSTARPPRCSARRRASAASSAGSTDRRSTPLTEYGNAYGMVFQIVDDVLDLTATDEQLGKPAGHDLVEGVYTLPVTPHAVERPQQRRRVARPPRQAARAGRARQGARDRALGRRHPERDRHGRESTPSARVERSTGSTTARSLRPCGGPLGAPANRPHRFLSATLRRRSRCRVVLVAGRASVEACGDVREAKPALPDCAPWARRASARSLRRRRARRRSPEVRDRAPRC